MLEEGGPAKLTSPSSVGPSRDDQQDVWIVYDGQCPFCSSYVMLYRLRENGQRVHLVDARSDHSLVSQVRALKLDLNAGMAVQWRGRFYYGAEAMHVLAILGSRKSLFNRMNRVAFSYPAIARILYPVFVLGRKITLRLLGRPLIPDQ
jgi:predicted DCC family thiol-disulfide oxidoreductase YuxK